MTADDGNVSRTFPWESVSGKVLESLPSSAVTGCGGPQPELTQDNRLWTRLLELARHWDGPEREKVYDALCTLRGKGFGVSVENGKGRLTQGNASADVYDQARDEYIASFGGKTLAALLASLVKGELPSADVVAFAPCASAAASGLVPVVSAREVIII